MVKGKIYILGAGISGLLAAFELAKKGIDVTVFEKTDIPGGQCKTYRFENYYVDTGPHLFHSNNNDIVSYWKENFGSAFITPELYALNYINGKYYEYPISSESMEQFSKEQQYKIKKELSKIDEEAIKKSKNFKEYMIALAGPTLQKMFFSDYPEKVWGIPVDELSPKWAPRRVNIRDKREPFHAGQWVGVPEYGCGQIADILNKKCKEYNVDIRYKSSVTNFEYSNKRLKKIIINNKDTININTDDIIISTLPIDILSNFLNIPHELSFRKIKLVSVFIDKDKQLFPENIGWMYFGDKDIIFNRVSIQTHFSKHGIPENKMLLVCEIIYDESDFQLSDNQIIDKSISDLINLKYINACDSYETKIFDLGSVYPKYTVGYEAKLQQALNEIDKYLNLYYIGSLAEYSYSDLQIIFAKVFDLVDLLTGSNVFKKDIIKHSTKRVKPNRIQELGDNKKIGENYPAYIIAEIGLNHNGSIDLAMQLIDAAYKAKVNAVKFQVYKKGRISSKVRTSRYYEDIIDTSESISQLLDRIIFSFDDFHKLYSYAISLGMDAFSTPFDFESVEFLENLNNSIYKISSMDLVNIPLIRHVAQLGKPILISTGMSTLSDIELALNTVLDEGNPNVSILHCISGYPCPASKANLNVINKLKNTFELPVGFSDHTTGIDISTAAVAIGAKIIEKHITLDKNMDGPDHNFSLEPEELANLVYSIRRVESALGSGEKIISSAELQSIQNLRRSIFAKVDIKAGKTLSPDIIEIKSPGIGMHPKYYDIIIGRKLKKDIKADMPINWDDI